MELRHLFAVAAVLLLHPAAALAGAPNYDCVAGGNARLSIDQWARVVATSGPRPGPTVWGTADDVNQDGGSLDVVAAVGGATWNVAVRGAGTSLVIERASGTLRGMCAFVPGNFVLRRADDGGTALRARPSPHARRLLVIPRGTAVWQIPDRSHSGRWMPIRAYVARNGEIRAVDGWLRQRQPLVPRYYASATS